MKPISILLVLITSCMGTSCENETVDNAADFKFETVDKAKNKLNLVGTIRYQLKNRLEKKLTNKYGRQYRDSLFIPALSTISNKILKDYSASEIYNYKRDEIVLKLDEQARTTFAEYEIKVTSFSIWSVELSDTLKNRLQKEHVERFQNAMSKCSNKTKGVITKIHDTVVYYAFTVDSKNFEGILNPEDTRDKINIGDSIAIEYACEDAIFHRVKK